MYTREEVCGIVAQMSALLTHIFPREKIEAVLFGSYARGDAEEGSDIDVMYLVDSPRQEIAVCSRQVGEAAAELLLSRGVLISPVVENRDYYGQNADRLPLFKNISREGVRIGA